MAVLLNARARKVTPGWSGALARRAARRPLPVASPKDARGIARTILTRGYDTVFCGGGDGTFIGFADEILSEAEAPTPWRPASGS